MFLQYFWLKNASLVSITPLKSKYPKPMNSSVYTIKYSKYILILSEKVAVIESIKKQISCL